MIDFEEMLEKLQQENLTLDQSEQSKNPEIIHGLKGKKNQDCIRRFNAISEYLKPFPINIISNLENAKDAVQKLKNSELLGIDIETSKTRDHPKAGLIPKISEIRLVQLFDGKNLTIFDCQKLGGVNWITPLTETHLVAHNASFDAQHFYHQGIEFTDLDCTMLMGRVFLNRNYSIIDAANEDYDMELDKSLQGSDWGREELLPEQIRYAALDAVITYQLQGRFTEGFDQDKTYRGTYQFLQSLIYPLVRQQAHGIEVDTAAHQKIIGEWKLRLTQATQELADDGLTAPDGVKAKQAYLANKLSDDEKASWPKTKTGNLSTDNDTLQEITNHPTLGLLAEYNTLSKGLGHYGDKLTALMVGGALYPSYQIAGMVSGRYGCREPNFQNQPRAGFKHIYIAPKGYQFVTGDLAQVELRVAGLLSEDPVIIDAYATGQDLHRLMASKMTGKPENKITKEERTAAKGVNFGLLFGGGARGLQNYVRSSYGVDMSLEEAQQAKQAFHNTYRDFTLWQRLIVKHTNQHDESESNFCKLRRHYDRKDHFRNGQYSDIYTHAMNFPVQSTAWEILALAILYIDEHAIEGIRISHHVYDELVLVAPDIKVKQAATLLRDAFRYGYREVFPGCNLTSIVEIGAGQNWAEAGSDENIIQLEG